MKVLIAGGGSGGHIFPGLALAEALRTVAPSTELLFVGSRVGLESRLVPPRGYALETIDVGRLKGAGIKQRLLTLLGLPLAILKAWRIVRRFNPGVVVGLGGYASAPVLVAAKLARRPTLLLEQNSVPGFTNRHLARFADRIVISFPQAATSFPAGRTLELGNPLRQALVDRLSAQQRQFHSTNVHLLILGGSQGATGLNQLLIDAAPLLKQRFGEQLFIHHQSGERDVQRVQRAYLDANVPARVEAFVDDMAVAYEQPCLAISRAGATTLAELALAGLPAILVPFPFAADDHQRVNAKHFVDHGAARVAEQDQSNGTKLTEMITMLLKDKANLAAMSQAMRRLSRPLAATEIAKFVLSMNKEITP